MPDLAFFPLAYLIKYIKPFSRVVFTGDGGDEVFLGYGNTEKWIKPLYDCSEKADTEYLRVGCEFPEWMSAWGCEKVSEDLLGQMFVRLGRAIAEQGIEARCPLLDSDIFKYVRGLKKEDIFFDRKSKALLKAQLPG